MKKCISLNSKAFSFGIHTIEIMHNGIALPTTTQIENCIINKYNRIMKDGEIKEWLVLNPNKYREGYLTSFSEVRDVLSVIIDELGIEHYYVVRVDFRVDDEEDTYDLLLKINKLFILLYASRYKVNGYQSFDPLTLEGLALSILNDYFEIQNYNKNLQSNGYDDFQNRLELRRKRLRLSSVDDIPCVFSYWRKNFVLVQRQFDLLQSKCNNALIRRWQEEKGDEVRSMSEFVRKYQQNFFTRNQLICFLGAVQPSENSSRQASNLQYTNALSLFKPSDVSEYFRIIETGISNFLTR